MYHDPLGSPLATLLESLEPGFCDHLSLHDITESYSLLATRCRYLLAASSSSQKPEPEFSILKHHSSSIIHLLRRDISGGPACATRHSNPAGACPLTGCPLWAKDAAVLADHCVKFISDLLTFPQLTCQFKSSDVETLLADVLNLAQPGSPTRLRALVIWTLCSQRLSPDVLVTRKAEIVTVVSHGLESKRNSVIIDSLQLLTRLSTEIPEQFTASCSHLLSRILFFCLHDDAEMRDGATKAFGALTLAGPLSPESLECVQSFVSLHYKSISSLLASPLQQHSNSTVQTGVKTSEANAFARAASSRWALSFCTALILSLRSRVFSHMPTLRLVVRFLMSAREYPKSRTVRTGARMAWRTLIWAYADLLMNDKKEKDFADMVFKTVKQGDMNGGIGAALVGTLIHLSHKQQEQQRAQPAPETQSENHIGEALKILRELIFSSKRPGMARDGIVMLQHILFPSSTASSQWELDGIIEHAFLDGRIIDSQWEGLEASTQALATSVPTLTESDLSADGRQEAVMRLLSDVLALQAQDHETMSEIEALWLHVARAPPSAISDASLTRLLIGNVAGLSHDTNHYRRVGHLWGLLADDDIRKAGTACHLLEALYIENEGPAEVREHIGWQSLLSALVRTMSSSNTLITSLKNLRDDQLTKTWLFLVQVHLHQNILDAITLTGSISLLIMRCPCDLAESQKSLWTSFLDACVQRRGVELLETLAAAVQELKFPLVRRPVLELLSALRIEECSFLPRAMLGLMSYTLLEAYPSQSLLALELMEKLSIMIKLCPKILLVDLLLALSDGLCVWLKDENEVLRDDIYNSSVATIYVASLAELRSLRSSISILQRLSSFFCAGFVRVPSPAIMPIAFREYWRENYEGCATFIAECPVELMTCLKAMQDAYGWGLGAGRSIESDSDTGSQQTVIVRPIEEELCRTASQSSDTTDIQIVTSTPKARRKRPTEREQTDTNTKRRKLSVGFFGDAQRELEPSRVEIHHISPRRRATFSGRDSSSVESRENMLTPRVRGTNSSCPGTTSIVFFTEVLGRKRPADALQRRKLESMDADKHASLNEPDNEQCVIDQNEEKSEGGKITLPSLSLPGVIVATPSIEPFAPVQSPEQNRSLHSIGHSRTMPDISHELSPTMLRRASTSLDVAMMDAQSKLKARIAATSKLDVQMLQEAYTRLRNDASQMQVEDLLKASHLVHKMSGMLHEKVAKKLCVSGEM